MKITPIPFHKAVSYWNNFLSFQSIVVPYSFNPSLFDFFKNHFDWKPYYFIIEIDGKSEAVCPIVNTGKSWVSLPHFSYGGVFSSSMYITKKSSFLINKLINEVDKQKIGAGFFKVAINLNEIEKVKCKKKIFIRSFGRISVVNFKKSEKATIILKLKDENHMFSMLSSNLRRKIRKAEKTGFKIKLGGEELVNDFYIVYLRNIKELKSLAYSKKFFIDIINYWKFGVIKLFVVYFYNEPVASSLLASYFDFYENLFFASIKNIRKYYVSDWLHWQMIKYSIKTVGGSQNKVYSFGRSTEYSSVYNYKIHWPADPVPLYVYSHGRDLRQIKGINTLKNFIPSKVIQSFAPFVIKHIY